MKKKAKNLNWIVAALALSLVAMIAFNAYLVLNGMERKQAIQPLAGPEPIPVNITIPEKPLSLDGYTKLEIGAEPSTVIMRDGCREIKASTTPEQAMSIDSAIRGQTPQRPISHDIALDIIGSLGASVTYARIDSMSQGIYYSKLVLKQNSTYYAFDARPSDAIAIALRANASVYMKASLFYNQSTDVC